MPPGKGEGIKRIRVIVHGTVQGVCFRYYARGEARRLGLRGWVRNLPEGTVEILAEGAPEALNELVRWSHTGSPGARVSRVDAEYVPLSDAAGPFEIRY